MEKRYYIAYGSNLNKQQMRWRCPDAKAVGTGTIRDYELLFKGSKSGNYLTVEEKIGGKIPVAVWEVSEADEANLDVYEGYPDFYYKDEWMFEFIDMETGETRLEQCFIYIMHEDRKLGIPSTTYIRTCLDGYRDFGFDRSALEEAYNVSGFGRR